MPSAIAQAPVEAAVEDSDRAATFAAVLDNPNLPSPPAVVLQIVEKASKPDCDPNEILSLLATDSGLCGQVLKTVNSGLYGLARPVSSLKQAVTVLGIRPLRSMVLSAALPAMRVTNRDEMVLKYWQESVTGAVVARQLAQILRRADPDDDLMAGLLRDLGVLILREVFPSEYRTLWQRAGTRWNAQQCDEERNAFGVDHAEVSAVILESWHLPANIYEPVRFHHDPAAYTDGNVAMKQRAAMLFFASKVATLHTTSTSNVHELVQFAKQHFAMDQAALIKFLSSVTPAVREFAGILKVDIGQCPNYPDIIAAGCQELVRLSMESKRSTVSPAKSSPEILTDPDDPTLKTHAYVAKSWRSNATNPTLPEFNMSAINQLPPEGAWLNGYEIKEILGRGGMGIVYKAFDPSLNRFAAIKMMTPERLVSSDARDLFKREARAAAAIQHENVVTIYAVSELNGLPYLVMEFLSGSSLQDCVEKTGPLPIESVIRFGRQIAKGMQAAHQRGVIHRDIKPANVLFSRETGVVKITDFGLARVQNDVLKSQEGTFAGTPAYMAPEQFTGAKLDHRADLFSLGSLLYTLCVGKPPFRGQSIPLLMNEVCNTAPAPVRSLRAEAPVWLGNVIAKLHAKAPAARYQSAAEVVRAFDDSAKPT